MWVSQMPTPQLSFLTVKPVVKIPSNDSQLGKDLDTVSPPLGTTPLAQQHPEAEGAIC